MAATEVILLVEDDANDAYFFQRALDEIGFKGTLRHVNNTDAAKIFIQDGGLPSLIVADSAVSVTGTGTELLEWMRANQFLKDVPFVILSGGVEPEMRERAEAAGVSRVLTKAANYKTTAVQLREVFSSFGLF